MPTSAEAPGSTEEPKISATQISAQRSGESSRPTIHQANMERSETFPRERISR
jgi:hypothetical protein